MNADTIETIFRTYPAGRLPWCPEGITEVIRRIIFFRKKLQYTNSLISPDQCPNVHDAFLYIKVKMLG